MTNIITRLTRSKRASALAAALLCMSTFFIPANAEELPKVQTNVLFVYDSSNSMWGHIDGRPKVELAKETLNDVITNLPPTAKLGLMAFGHRRKGDCSDIELISPIGTQNADQIKATVNKLQPIGITPLSAALSQAADAFKGINSAKMIVLITDGGEECQSNPCETAHKLAMSGLVVRVNVVGINVSTKDREELQCIAKEGTGRFFEVKDKPSLFKAIDDISKEARTYAQPTPKPAPPALDPSARKRGVNLLLPENGGKILSGGKVDWTNSISGADLSSTWIHKGQEVIFGFKDDYIARFWKFTIAIPETAPQNVKEFELLASKDSIDGPYFHRGRFITRNELQKSPVQEFMFNETVAKYFKVKFISNFDGPEKDGVDTEVFQINLTGAAL